MYKIYSGSTQVGVTENLNYIKKVSNGCFNLCGPEDAQGIAFNGEKYSLGINGGIENVPEAVLEYVDTAEELQKTNNATGIAFVTMAEAGTIDDVTAGEHADLFAEWAPGVTYKMGDMRRYHGKLYRCIQDHTSQGDWDPQNAVSLWVNISDPADEWPAWSQPVGAHDAYQTGDKVTHNENHWVSTADNNVWEPGVYGWTEAAEEE